jgi:propionyl-CoA carboxylase alpha chain
LTIDGAIHHFRLRYSGNFIWAAFCGITRTFEIYSPLEWKLARYMPPPVRKGLENVLDCPMPGLIVAVRVKPGDRVYRGQEMVVIESMKMETSVASPCDGEVDSVMVKAGDEVETGRVLVSFKPPQK